MEREVFSMKAASSLRAALAGAFAWLLLAGASPAPACPMCKSGLSPDEELKNVAAQLQAEAEKGAMSAEQAAKGLAIAEAKAVERFGFTRGFAYSIYFMLFALMSVMGGTGFVIVRAAKEGLKRQERFRELLASPSNPLAREAAAGAE
jgi:hypothetical protein